MIKTAHINILEAGAVSLAAGTEDPDYPLYRLYDRNTGRPFMITQAETLEVLVDQGATGPYTSVDRLLIPAGHNLEGMTLDIKYSDDDITYYNAVAQWSGTQGVQSKSWSPIAKRYWKFVVTTPGSVPSFAELFLTATYEWERQPARSAGPLEDIINVASAISSGGRQRFLVSGPPRVRRAYRVPRCPASMRDEMLLLWQSWGQGLAFWLMDHDGQWLMGGLDTPLSLREEGYGSSSLSFEFSEVLP